MINPATVYQFQAVIKAIKKITERLLEWQIFEEERLEAKLQREFKKAKQEILERFDKKFVPKYRAKKDLDFIRLITLLNEGKFYPTISYSPIGTFRFKRYTVPIKIQKQSKASLDLIEALTMINPDPFAEALDDSVFRGYGAGGQSVFSTFDIKVDFQLRDKLAEKKLKNFNLQLSTAVSTEISTKIKHQLLEGVKNSESIPELRRRIVRSWNKPIDVVVPTVVNPKTGQVLRQGYTYSLTANQWATTVARTEVSRAFAQGRLEAYTQTKVVEKVQFMITPDERLCPNCQLLDGEQFSLEAATSIIPVHAMCRCTWVPVLKAGDDPIGEARKNIEELYMPKDIDKALKATGKVSDDLIKTMDVKGKQDLFKVLDDIKRNYRKDIWDDFGGFNSMSDWAEDQARYFTNRMARKREILVEKRNVYGQYDPSSRIISLNTRKDMFGNDSALLRGFKADIQTGYHPQGCKPISIIYHEFGHYLDFRYWQIGTMTQHPWVVLRQEIVEVYTLPHHISMKLSRYATKDFNKGWELIAELWSQYKDAPKSVDKGYIKLIKKIDDLMKKKG
jgi:SPP1 gp7 family putative phage head morphogenesis protein